MKYGSLKCRENPLYKKWTEMKQRCQNPNNPSFKDYGGRGICVSKRWLNFANFQKDMVASYRPGLTLERIDNNGNYSRANCRWATKKEQANNRRSSHLIIFRGQTKTLSQWAEKIGVRLGTLNQRFFVYKWSITKCLTYNQ